MANNIEDKRRELMQMMMNALSVNSDEVEGTQVVNIDNMHGCNTDYIDYDEPKLTPQQIADLLHFSDFGLGAVPSKGGAPDNLSPKDKDKRAPDTNNAGLSGDKAADGDRDPNDSGERGDGWPYTGYPDNTGYPGDGALDYGDIKIPDDVQLDDIVDAIINDDTIGPTRAVIEFAQPCIRDSKGVDFEFVVKPGDELDENTIIAFATVNGKRKPVRSIFGKGRVMAINTPDGPDFKHLYDGYGANRHIIIENYVISGGAPEVNTEAIERIQNEFKDEASFQDLITNNLCESVLPWILQRRYNNILFPGYRNGREIFEEYMRYVNDIREQYQRDMKNLASADNVKKTNGNIRKMDELSNAIIARRRKYGEDIIYAYREYKQTLDRCKWDVTLEDCKYLAYVKEIEGYQSTSTRVGEANYFNYYVALQSMLDTYQDNKYVDEYRLILQEIIEERIYREGYNLSEIKDEFNSLFFRIIGFVPTGANAFHELDKAMNKLGEEPKISDVAGWIGQHAKRQDEFTQFSIKQLANIYMFVRNYTTYNPDDFNKEGNRVVSRVDARNRKQSKTKKQKKDNLSLLKLVEKENNKLEEFWKRMIAHFETTTIQTCIDKVTEFVDKVNAYAEWPQPSQITYNDEYYDLYLFQNDTQKKMEPDGDVDYGTEAQEEMPIVPDPLDVPEVTLDDLKMGPDNIQEGEITIKDYDYWKKYFALATIISLPFLNCGLDIPPASIMMIPLPCIYIALACTYIKPLDLVLVVGLSIRGMYIWPVFLYVNCSQMPLSIMTPLIAQVKSIKSKISAKVNGIAELSVGSIADGFIKMVEDDSRELRKQNKELETLINQIQLKKVNNQEAIKKRMDKLFKPGCKTTQQIIDPIGELNK